ncbi:MAG: DUF1553 domain-containing protein, partial [Verrucomicrobiota bacterium]
KAFGLGLIEPVDNLKEFTVASNPELMDHLEALMQDLNFNIKSYLRIIYNTQAYQREASLEEVPIGAPYHFQGPTLRRMSAEQIWDSIVTLAVEDIDSPDEAHELYMDSQIMRRQLMGEAVYNETPKDFLRDGMIVYKKQKELSSKIHAAEAQLVAAREADDAEAIASAATEVRAIRAELANFVQTEVFAENLKGRVELASLTDTETERSEFLDEVMAYASDAGGGDMTAGLTAMIDDKNSVISQIVAAMLSERKEAIKDSQDASMTDDRKAWNVKNSDQLATYRAFKKNTSQLKRASELRSPAPLGHFLREFGQSDRELIENASDGAAVTQALALLNGPITGAVTNRYSVLMRELSNSENFRERV